jgi:hypothetical protein
MPLPLRLDQALDGITGAVQTLLEAEVKSGGLLEGVTSITRGDKARGNPYPPCLWVWIDTANPDTYTVTRSELWEIPVTIVSVVKDSDPESGYAAATTLAAKARSTILCERDLGGLAYVREVKSGRFTPSSPYYRDDKSQCSAAAEILVKFITLE